MHQPNSMSVYNLFEIHWFLAVFPRFPGFESPRQGDHPPPFGAGLGTVLGGVLSCVAVINGRLLLCECQPRSISELVLPTREKFQINIVSRLQIIQFESLTE